MAARARCGDGGLRHHKALADAFHLGHRGHAAFDQRAGAVGLQADIAFVFFGLGQFGACQIKGGGGLPDGRFGLRPAAGI
jgi:hypothetical protein